MSHTARRSLPCLVVLLAVATAAAGIPRQISYQGRLFDGSGPMTGTLDITFALYDVATGGSAIWQETHSGVTVTEGLFTVRLGSVDPAGNPLEPTLFSEPERWLAVTVGAGPELAPRQRLTSAAFAMRAAVADTVSPGAVTGAMIAPATITYDKLATTCSEGQLLVMTASGWACGQHWSQQRPAHEEVE
jgi:hypothetical protein